MRLDSFQYPNGKGVAGKIDGLTFIFPASSPASGTMRVNSKINGLNSFRSHQRSR
ncbi:MAG: hypothetical protein KBF45_15195 [Cyclobacteriaceae bacterium]|nr:hypothetical protein [Cyclobacteriaceae bacterium]